jgi:hypothetical protein
VLIVTLAKSGDAYGRICYDLRLFGLLGTPNFSKRTLRLQSFVAKLLHLKSALHT